MCNDLNLKGNDLLVYAIIYGFSQDGETRFKGSRQYLADWCGCTTRGIDKNLKNLIDMGLIKKYETFKNGIKFCEYECVRSSPVENKVHGGSEHSSLYNIANNIEELEDNTNVLSRKAEIDNFLQSDIADKPKKKNLYQKCQDSIIEFTIDLEVREKLSEYLGIRLEMAKDKPFGIRTFDSMLKKLRTYTESKAECLKIIQQSIDRQYLTFYPLKEYKKATRTKENFESMDIQETYKADKEDISIGTQF
jgi:hypothetical protein